METIQKNEQINELVLEYQYCSILLNRLYHNGEFIYRRDFDKSTLLEERQDKAKQELRSIVGFFDYYILFYLARDIFYKKYSITCPLI